jgi:Heavy-metal resistance
LAVRPDGVGFAAHGDGLGAAGKDCQPAMKASLNTEVFCAAGTELIMARGFREERVVGIVPLLWTDLLQKVARATEQTAPRRCLSPRMEEVAIMKKLSFVTLFAAMLSFAPNLAGSTLPATASRSLPCPPPPAVVASFLELTPGQVEQMAALLARVLPALESLGQQSAEVQQQLDLLLSQTNPDPAQIGKLVVELHMLQLQAARVVEGFHNAFAGLLTQDQKQKLEGVTLASQLQPVVGAFAALYLVPLPPSTSCQKQ